MSEEITEHVSYDRGYNKGFVSGLKEHLSWLVNLVIFMRMEWVYQKMQQMKKTTSRKFKKKSSKCVSLCSTRYSQKFIRRRRFTLVIMNTIKEKYKTTLNHRLECIQEDLAVLVDFIEKQNLTDAFKQSTEFAELFGITLATLKLLVT